MTPPQITVSCGRFGSGKTEIALNYAVQLAARLADQGISPLLVDLDIVALYFRTRDRAEEIARRGVETITPFDAGHSIDVPAISPRIPGAIEQSKRPVVIDLGCDQQRSRALAQYASSIDRRGYVMSFVVNPHRW